MIILLGTEMRIRGNGADGLREGPHEEAATNLTARWRRQLSQQSEA